MQLQSYVEKNLKSASIGFKLRIKSWHISHSSWTERLIVLSLQFFLSFSFNSHSLHAQFEIKNKKIKEDCDWGHNSSLLFQFTNAFEFKLLPLCIHVVIECVVNDAMNQCSKWKITDNIMIWISLFKLPILNWKISKTRDSKMNYIFEKEFLLFQCAKLNWMLVLFQKYGNADQRNRDCSTKQKQKKEEKKMNEIHKRLYS